MKTNSFKAMANMATDRIAREADIATPEHGQIALANSASFNNTFFSEALTNYALGWKDGSDLQAMLEFLFPPVQVSRRFDFRSFGANDDFLYETDDARAVGADFKRVEYKGAIQSSKTVNKGLCLFVDLDEVAGMDNWEIVYTGRLIRRCMRNDLYTAIAALVAGATLSSKNWGPTNTSRDPDADIMNLIDTSGDAIGFNPNRVAFLGNTWVKRALSYRALDTIGGRASAGLTTPSEVAQFCGAEQGMKIDHRVAASKTGAKSKGAANNVIAFMADNGIGPEDPSCCKMFWSPCGDGSRMRVYSRQVSEKLHKLTVERYNRMVVTSTTGIVGHTITFT